MKKRTKFCARLLALVLLLMLLPQRAEAASASLTGNSTAQAGSTITLKLNISGSNIGGVTAKLNYDSNVLEFSSYERLVSGWNMDVNGTFFVLYGSSSINSSAVLSVTFKVKSSAAEGTAMSASFGDITASDGTNEMSISSAGWSGTVSAGPSKVCDLSSLTCSNATLSPSFSGNTTYYTATVPFSVESLKLNYTAKDKTAKVSVSGNSLVVGVNTVTVTCTAASGAKKSYTISVTRQQDPNYKASTDAMLSALTLDAATISPAFAPEITDYVAYVPFETTEVKLTGAPKDSKATGVSEDVRTQLAEGETVMSVICTAEDGVTTKTYTVHVYRMPLYEGVLPLVTATDLSTETDVEEIALPAMVNVPLLGKTPIQTAAIIGAAFLAVVLLLIGFLLGRIGQGGDGGNDDRMGRGRDRAPKLPPPGDRRRPGEADRHESLAHSRPAPQPERRSRPEERPRQEMRPRQEERARPELFDDAKALFEEPVRKPRPGSTSGNGSTSQPTRTPASDTSAKPKKSGDETEQTMSLEELLDDIRRL